MPRKRHSRHSRGGFGGFGGGKIMNGIFTPKGLIASAVIGVGTASVARRFINIHPLQDEALGFITGGVVGAGAVYLLKHFGTATTSSGTTQNPYNY